MTVFIVSFWLFYISHLTNESEIVNYKSLVSFAVHLVDALLFVHYLAIILVIFFAQYFMVRNLDNASKELFSD